MGLKVARPWVGLAGSAPHGAYTLTMMYHFALGGVPGFLCRLINEHLIATNCGAEKSGVLLFRKFENMGGVYAVVYMPF